MDPTGPLLLPGNYCSLLHIYTVAQICRQVSKSWNILHTNLLPSINGPLPIPVQGCTRLGLSHTVYTGYVATLRLKEPLTKFKGFKTRIGCMQCVHSM